MKNDEEVLDATPTAYPERATFIPPELKDDDVIVSSGALTLTDVTRRPQNHSRQHDLTQPLLATPSRYKLFREEQKRMPGEYATMASQATIGFVRDVVWALSTSGNQDIFDDRLHAFWGLTVSQMLTALAPMLVTTRMIIDLGLRGRGGTFFIENRKNWIKKQLTFALASWSSIPVWNGAQLLGYWVGDKLSLNEGANYFMTGVIIGIAETLMQNGIVIPRLTKQPIDWLDLTLNTLAGAVWFLVMVLLFKNDDDIPEQVRNASVLASSVALSFISMTLIAKQIHRRYPGAPEAQIDASDDEESQPDILQSHTINSPRTLP